MRLPGSLKARVTGFFDADRDVSDFVATCGASLACTSVTSVDGSTYGLELLVERALTRRLGGWLSYTLSRAQRDSRRPAVSLPLRPHPRPVGRRSLRSRDGATARACAGTYYTGRPDLASIPNSLPQVSNQHRLPDYYRLDARLDKRWEPRPPRVADGRGRVLRRDPDQRGRRLQVRLPHAPLHGRVRRPDRAAEHRARRRAGDAAARPSERPRRGREGRAPRLSQSAAGGSARLSLPLARLSC